MKFVFAYITTSSKEEARRLGRHLVENHFAACVNILSPMESIYWWEGKMEEAVEAVLIAKTTEEKAAHLVDEVKKKHSYTCPCIVLLPVSGGNEKYLNWLAENV